MTQSGLQCPECRKYSVVQKKETLYVCLGCDFKKDLNPPPKKPKTNFGIVLSVGVFALLLMSVLTQVQTRSTNLVQPTRWVPTSSPAQYNNPR